MSSIHVESAPAPALKRHANHPQAWFAVWVVVGAALAFSDLDGFGAGFFVLPFAVVAVVVLIVRHHLDRSAWGLLGGIGVLSLYMAYLQRQGPGTVYWHTASASGWQTYADPRPWLIAGLLLIAVGVVAFVWRGRSVRKGEAG